MTGISGVMMWMEDWLINSSSYDKNYQNNFIKVKNLWNECVKEFKACNSISKCNDAYSKYEAKVDNLKEEMSNFYGNPKKIPIGISDCLDYFEEAVGDLEDKAITKLTNSNKKFSVVLPEDEGKFVDTILKGYKSKYLELDFTRQGSHIKVEGEFWDVRSFLERHFPEEDVQNIIDEGEFEDD